MNTEKEKHAKKESLAVTWPHNEKKAIPNDIYKF